MYEESIRIPMLINDPRVSKARTIEALTLNIDIAPTILDLAGVVIPKEMQGRSLLSWVQGKRVKDWRRDFLYEHHTMTKIIPEVEGVRTERWKYVRWMNASPIWEELFDLAKDPESCAIWLANHNIKSNSRHYANAGRSLRTRASNRAPITDTAGATRLVC